MLKNKALKSISCVAHVDSDALPHQKVTTRTRRISSSKCSDIEADEITGSGSRDENQADKTKVSNFHRKWSKLKKKLSGNSESHPSSEQDQESSGNVFVSMEQPSRCLQNEKIVSEITEMDLDENLKFSYPNHNIKAKVSKEPSFNNYESYDNVERWLRRYHQDTSNTGVHKKHDHLKKKNCEVGVFDSANHHHYNHITLRQKHPSSPAHLPQLRNVPVIDLNQCTSNELRVHQTSTDKAPQKCPITCNEDSLSRLNPSLLQFITELVEGLEKLQRSYNSESTKNILMASHSTTANASTIRNSIDIARHDITNQQDEPCGKKRSSVQQKFSTSTPIQMTDMIHPDEDSHVDERADTFTDGTFKSNVFPQEEVNSPSITMSTDADTQELRIHIEGEELIYKFQNDPKELLDRMRMVHQRVRDSHETIFSILESIIDRQSRIIMKLNSKLRSKDRHAD